MRARVEDWRQRLRAAWETYGERAEAEEAWRVSEPILDAWRSGQVPLLENPAGSDGPSGVSLAPATGVQSG